MLEFKDVKFKYPDGTRVLNGLSFTVNEGEFVYVIGPTGVGKSTIAKLITSEVVPTSGSVMFNNINVGKLKKRQIPLYRRKLGVVYQNFLLLEDNTCLENITFVLEMSDMSKKECLSRARVVLKMVNLQDKPNKFPKDLSGGEKQRLAIARAIAHKPKLLICDEPTANLDPVMADEIMNIIENINKETGTAVIFITHNSLLVNERRKRTVVLDGGVVSADLKEGGYILHNDSFRKIYEQEEMEETKLLTNLLSKELDIDSLSDEQKNNLLRRLLNERNNKQ